MDFKLLELSNCCCIVPLRAGLLIFGYINLLYYVLCFISAVYGALFFSMFMTYFAHEFPPVEMWLISPLLKFSEVVFFVFVVVSTHDLMKDARLYKVTFLLGIALLVFTIPYSICIICRLGILGSIPATTKFADPKSLERFGNCIYISMSVFDPILLGYTLLLVRSLKVKPISATGESIDLETNRVPEVDYERLLPTSPTTQSTQ